MGILVKNSGNPDSTCDRSGQIYTCGIFYYFVLDMDSFEKSVSFISFLMVLPVIYTNILEGIRQTDRKILEMAKVFRVNLRRQIRYIYVSQVLPYFLSACRLSLGMCWKAGVAAEVIGVPSGSIGEKLYNAKIYLNTPDLFAWTIVIIVISFVFEKCFLGIVSRVVYMIEHK